LCDGCNVNEEPLAPNDPRQLTHGDIIQLGASSYFRFVHPAEASKQRERGIVPDSVQILHPRQIKQLKEENQQLKERLEEQQVSFETEKKDILRQIKIERHQSKRNYLTIANEIAQYRLAFPVFNT
jgi:hypothetical protein